MKKLFAVLVIFGTAVLLYWIQGAASEDATISNGQAYESSKPQGAKASLQRPPTKPVFGGDRFVQAWGFPDAPVQSDTQSYLGTIREKCKSCANTLDGFRASYVKNCKSGEPSVELLKKWEKSNFYVFANAIQSIVSSKEYRLEYASGYCLVDGELPKRLNNRDFYMINGLPPGDMYKALQEHLYARIGDDVYLNFDTIIAERIFDAAVVQCADEIQSNISFDKSDISKAMKECVLKELDPAIASSV